MDKFERNISIGGMILCGGLAACALIGALFFGAVHQFVVAGIAIGMTAAIWAGYRRDKKEARNSDK